MGQSNYRRPGTKSLKLSRLPLEGDRFHIYDYWEQTYLGVQDADYEWSGELGAHEGKLFAVVPVAEDGRPTLISTSRHFSQGALDIERLEYRRRADGWVVSGESSHLVKGDPYELVFAARDVRDVEASAGKLEASVTRDKGVVRVRLIPKKSGGLEWSVIFADDDG